MPRRRRRYHGPHPYARVGCRGPAVGCGGCLIVLIGLAVLIVVVVLAA